jgi:CHASE2 domain-containing sensor protein
MRKLSEAGETGVALLREQERIAARRTREGMKVGGLVNVAVGIGLVAFLLLLTGSPVAFCGLIPLFIGFALLGYAFFVTAKE